MLLHAGILRRHDSTNSRSFASAAVSTRGGASAAGWCMGKLRTQQALLTPVPPVRLMHAERPDQAPAGGTFPTDCGVKSAPASCTRTRVTTSRKTVRARHSTCVLPTTADGCATFHRCRLLWTCHSGWVLPHCASLSLPLRKLRLIPNPLTCGQKLVPALPPLLQGCTAMLCGKSPQSRREPIQHAKNRSREKRALLMVRCGIEELLPARGRHL